MRALFKFADGVTVTVDKFDELQKSGFEGPQDVLESIKYRRDRNDNFSFTDDVNGVDVVKKGQDLVAVEFIF